MASYLSIDRCVFDEHIGKVSHWTNGRAECLLHFISVHLLENLGALRITYAANNGSTRYIGRRSIASSDDLGSRREVHFAFLGHSRWLLLSSLST